MSELPPGNANLPPASDWLSVDHRIDGGEREAIVATKNRRWMLRRHGETVMWGEGTIHLQFAEMSESGHDPSGYELLLGEKAGSVPDEGYEVFTPDGEPVGNLEGTVSHKATPVISPDVRARQPGGDDGDS